MFVQIVKIRVMNNYLEQLQNVYRNDDDFCTRKIDCGLSATIAFLDSMCSDVKISNYVVEPMVYGQGARDFSELKKRLTAGAVVKEVANFFDVLDAISNGHTAVFVEENCLLVDTRTTLARAIVEPPTSMVMRGPREGFIEDAKTNLTLIRKRLKTPDLKVTTLNVGKLSTIWVQTMTTLASTQTQPFTCVTFVPSLTTKW